MQVAVTTQFPCFVPSVPWLPLWNTFVLDVRTLGQLSSLIQVELVIAVSLSYISAEEDFSDGTALPFRIEPSSAHTRWQPSFFWSEFLLPSFLAEQKYIYSCSLHCGLSDWCTQEVLTEDRFFYIWEMENRTSLGCAVRQPLLVFATLPLPLKQDIPLTATNLETYQGLSPFPRSPGW